MKILLAVDGSAYSDAAVEEVVKRRGRRRVRSRLSPWLSCPDHCNDRRQEADSPNDSTINESRLPAAAVVLFN